MQARQFASNPIERGRDPLFGSVAAGQFLLDGVSHQCRWGSEPPFSRRVADLSDS
jgi:hypothetical protein